MVYAPFRECVVLSLDLARAFVECDPNVFVRRIDASFRKRGNSLSGDPCQSCGGGSVARGSFSVGSSIYPTFAVLLLCSRQSILWRSRLRAVPVLVFLLNGERIIRRGGYALRVVFLPCRQARDARHHGLYGPGGLFCWFFTLSFALCSSGCSGP